MAQSRKSDAVPYAVGGAILLFGVLSAVSVLVPQSGSPSAAATVRPVAVAASAASTPAVAASAPVVALAASAPAVEASAPTPGASTAAPLPLPASSVPAPPPVATPASQAAPAVVHTAPTPAPAPTIAPPAPVPVPAPAPAPAPAPVVASTPAMPAKVVEPPPIKAAHAKAAAPVKPPRAERVTVQAPALAPPPAMPVAVAPSPALPLPAPMAQAPLEGPKAFTAPPSAAKKDAAVVPEQPTKAANAGSGGPALVTASGNKAWIRLDERRTVAVEKGQSLEGYGAFIGIEKGVAKFERGSVASKAETNDASARN